MRQRRITEVAALRHVLQIKRRLQLEMLASISKLLREHEVNADDNLLASLVLAVPEELMDDNTSTLGSLRLASNMATKKGARRASKPKKSPKPQPGDPDKAPRPQPPPVRSPRPQPPPDKSPKPQAPPKKKRPRPQPPKKNPRPQP